MKIVPYLHCGKTKDTTLCICELTPSVAIMYDKWHSVDHGDRTRFDIKIGFLIWFVVFGFVKNEK